MTKHPEIVKSLPRISGVTAKQIDEIRKLKRREYHKLYQRMRRATVKQQQNEGNKDD